MKWHFLFASWLFLFDQSPAFAQDGALRLKGRIVDASGKLYYVCKLDLFLATGESLIRVYGRTIEGQFEFSVPGPPFKDKYVVSANCRDAQTSYQSNVIELGGKAHTDLGEIVLQRK